VMLPPGNTGRVFVRCGLAVAILSSLTVASCGSVVAVAQIPGTQQVWSAEAGANPILRLYSP
jgi:hypothetical protein